MKSRVHRFNKWVQTCSSPYLLAIREGLIWVVPCLMISSFSLFIASMGEFVLGERPDWIEILYRIHDIVLNLFSYLMTAAISYILAMQWRLPRPPVAMLTILYLAIIENLFLTQGNGESLKIVMAIITPLYTVPMLSYLLRIPLFKLTRANSGGKIVKESLNLIIPAALTAVIVILLNAFVLGAVTEMNFTASFNIDYATQPYEFGMLFAVYNSILWFFGIHGYYALFPLVEMLQEAAQINYAASLSGEIIPNIMSLPFMGVFVFIGGSGATLSLIIAILLFSTEKSVRLIAMASIPIALFNVNEILLFGLPIIFNPRLFLPFLIAPLVNVLLGLTGIGLGLVNAPSFPVPFNSPIFINAWLATGGDFGAVIMQLINIIVGVGIYYPAVRSLNRFYNNAIIAIPSLDTTYQRLQESAEVLSADAIRVSQIKEKHITDVETQLANISTNEFCLEYQPQICRHSKKVIGCEALIRAVDGNGNKLSPASFLPWLEKAGLMKDLDVWVFKQCVKDVLLWREKGIDVPISINLCATTIVDIEYMQKIEQIIQPIAESVHIEITEESLLEDHHTLEQAISRLHSMNVSIYIDDFGTGYSSLSYLNLFDIDAIKIDRSFVMALSTDKGKKIFASLIAIAAELKLNVVVEGVEELDQLNCIPESKSVAVQGWYYSKSLNINDFCLYCHDNLDVTHSP